MKKSLSFVVVLSVVGVVFGGAVPTMADQCKPVDSRVGPSTYLEPCTYDETEYLYCIDAPIMGTLNGIWHYYGNGEQVEARRRLLTQHCGLDGLWTLSRPSRV